MVLCLNTLVVPHLECFHPGLDEPNEVLLMTPLSNVPQHHLQTHNQCSLGCICPLLNLHMGGTSHIHQHLHPPLHWEAHSPILSLCILPVSKHQPCFSDLMCQMMRIAGIFLLMSFAQPNLPPLQEIRLVEDVLNQGSKMPHTSYAATSVLELNQFAHYHDMNLSSCYTNWMIQISMKLWRKLCERLSSPRLGSVAWNMTMRWV